MATVVSTPVLSYIAAPLASGTAFGQSAQLTVAVTVPGVEAAWAVQLLQPNTTAITAGPECYAYRSADGGTTYETVPYVGRSIVRNAAGSDRVDLVLPTGYWLLRVVSGGAGGTFGTSSFWLATAAHITAWQNV